MEETTVGVLKHVTRMMELREKVKGKQVKSQRHVNEDVAARIGRLYKAIDCEPFGGWLAKQGTLDRLALLHRAYADDQQFLRVLSGMILWAPDEYIGDTSVLRTGEVTTIGSSTSLATWSFNESMHLNVAAEHVQLSCQRKNDEVVVRVRNNAPLYNEAVVSVERTTETELERVAPGSEIDLGHMDLLRVGTAWFTVLLYDVVEKRIASVASASPQPVPAPVAATRSALLSLRKPATRRSNDGASERSPERADATTPSASRAARVGSLSEQDVPKGKTSPRSRRSVVSVKGPSEHSERSSDARLIDVVSSLETPSSRRSSAEMARQKKDEEKKEVEQALKKEAAEQQREEEAEQRKEATRKKVEEEKKQEEVKKFAEETKKREQDAKRKKEKETEREQKDAAKKRKNAEEDVAAETPKEATEKALHPLAKRKLDVVDSDEEEGAEPKEDVAEAEGADGKEGKEAGEDDEAPRKPLTNTEVQKKRRGRPPKKRSMKLSRGDAESVVSVDKKEKKPLGRPRSKKPKDEITESPPKEETLLPNKTPKSMATPIRATRSRPAPPPKPTNIDELRKLEEEKAARSRESFQETRRLIKANTRRRSSAGNKGHDKGNESERPSKVGEDVEVVPESEAPDEEDLDSADDDVVVHPRLSQTVALPTKPLPFTSPIVPKPNGKASEPSPPPLRSPSTEAKSSSSQEEDPLIEVNVRGGVSSQSQQCLDNLLARVHRQCDPKTGSRLVTAIGRSNMLGSPTSQSKPVFSYSSLHTRVKSGLYKDVASFAKDIHAMLVKNLASMPEGEAKVEIDRMSKLLREIIVDLLRELQPSEVNAVKAQFAL